MVGKIIDNPGFEDTRGDVHDVLNSYSVSRLFRKGKNIKLVIVIEFNNITNARGGKISEIIPLIRRILFR